MRWRAEHIHDGLRRDLDRRSVFFLFIVLSVFFFVLFVLIFPFVLFVPVLIGPVPLRHGGAPPWRTTR